MCIIAYLPQKSFLILKQYHECYCHRLLLNYRFSNRTAPARCAPYSRYFTDVLLSTGQLFDCLHFISPIKTAFTSSLAQFHKCETSLNFSFVKLRQYSVCMGTNYVSLLPFAHRAKAQVITPRQLWSVTRAGCLMDSMDQRFIKQDYEEYKYLQQIAMT